MNVIGEGAKAVFVVLWVFVSIFAFTCAVEITVVSIRMRRFGQDWFAALLELFLAVISAAFAALFAYFL